MARVVCKFDNKIVKKIKQKEYTQYVGMIDNPFSSLLRGTMRQLLDNKKQIERYPNGNKFIFEEIKFYREVEFDYDEIFGKLNSKLEDYEIIGKNLIEKVMELHGTSGENLNYCINGIIEIELKEKEYHKKAFENLRNFLFG